MSRTVFVTGAAGFIGSHLAEALLARGDRVVGFDNLNEFYDPALKKRNVADLSRYERFRFVVGDIRDSDAVVDTLEDTRPDSVVHLAAMAGVRPSIEKPSLYADVNVRGTSVILEAAAAGSPERFVFASSSSVYGERSDPPFREADRVDHPVSPYAATKKAGELLCHAVHSASGMPVTVLRYFTAYGPRQRPEMAIAKFTRLIRERRPVPMFGDGTSGRDYTFVSDIVGGTVRALDRCEGYEIYNLGGAAVTTLRELLDVLGEELGMEVVVERCGSQQGDVTLTSACVDRARRDLGYTPGVAIREGVAKYVAWCLGGSS